MNKQLYEDLQEFVNRIKWDIIPERCGRLAFSVSCPKKGVFSDDQNRIIFEAMNSFLHEVINPILNNTLPQFKNTEITERTAAEIRGYICRLEAERIHDGQLSFKDEIRSRLGLSPDPGMFLIGTYKIDI